MRRSAAPSIRDGIKRPRCSFDSPPKSPIVNVSWNSVVNVAVTKPETKNYHIDEIIVRTKEEILKLILDPPSDNEEETAPTLQKVQTDKIIPSFQLKNKPKSVMSSSIFQTSSINKVHKNVGKEAAKENISGESNLDSTAELKRFYSVMWCKRSAKKHKKWDGDGVLVIRNRSATLKDLTGKQIDQGLGYKWKEVSNLEEGSPFYIGGKECQIQYVISEDDYLKGKCFEGLMSASPEKDKQEPKKHLAKPTFIRHCQLPAKLPVKIIENEIENPACEKLLLPSPPEHHQKSYNKAGLSITPVEVEGFLACHLRPHQKEGIIFMYKCIMGFQDCGEGVILADEMGLGKTLQCIALIWTLYKQGPYGGKPALRKVIIITPSSLVNNWEKEIHKWLGKSRLSIFAVDQQNKIKDYLRSPRSVLIISYEMFLRSAELLSDIPFNLVICDEGHRIKNLNIKTSNVVNCLTTTKRILLTGTPIQNDLEEFFSIVEFVNPGVLGTVQSFRKHYEKPIMDSRNPECSEEEKEDGDERSEELANITKMFVLRRTQEVINPYLPSKTETVIFCRPSFLQKQLYTNFLQSGIVSVCLSDLAADGAAHLMCISALRKLCNHPQLLYQKSMDQDSSNKYSAEYFAQAAFPQNYCPSLNDSGKLKVLKNILEAVFSLPKKEKVVIVSAFTKTLNVIENYICRAKGYDYLRLDGSTITSHRQKLVDSFNLPYSKHMVFLLSSKAGGVGFNLIGASRIVLYDIDWNPANDLQAMARVWRDGQKHSVYIYRLLTTGTIEEKIFERQVSKQSLSGELFNSGAKSKLKFSKEELKDLFTFHNDVQCLTHDAINCPCIDEDKSEGVEIVYSNIDGKVTKPPNINMSELLKWKHVPGPITSQNCSDCCLANKGDDITFLFVNSVNQ